MTLELNDEERDALVGLLQREISDLAPEIRHTQTSTYREELKATKALLRRISGRLLGAATT